jgi:hypothetical protein
MTDAISQYTEIFADSLTGPDDHLTPIGDNWSVRPVGELPEGDGITVRGSRGLTVVPARTDERSGEPAFAVLPISQDLRWAAFATSHGSGPGRFPIGDGLQAAVTLSVAETGGWDRPHSTTTAGLVVADFATGLVLDLMLGPTSAVVIYEKLGPDGFCYRVQVGDRKAENEHRCAIEVRGATAHFRLDNNPVLSVERIGEPCLPARYLERGSDRDTPPVHPMTVSAGLGMLTTEPAGQGLRLSARDFSVRIAQNNEERSR